MHLKDSKGSKHEQQRCNALQGVEPNWLMRSVFKDWQRGQAAGLSARVAGGGAMPYSASLRCPSGVIHALDHAGESTVVTSTGPRSASRSARSTECRMASTAGQPV